MPENRPQGPETAPRPLPTPFHFNESRGPTPDLDLYREN